MYDVLKQEFGYSDIFSGYIVCIIRECWNFEIGNLKTQTLYIFVVGIFKSLKLYPKATVTVFLRIVCPLINVHTL